MATSVANVMFTNAVYFPNFKIYSGATPGMMNYSCISHVFYAFASLAADGSVFVSRARLPLVQYAEHRSTNMGQS
jgi:chitinase